MKHMKTVIVPAETTNVVSFVTCDLCKTKIETAGVFAVDETTVHHKVGKYYPEGGSGTETVIDICGKCFDEKLVPWVKAQGAEPTVTELNW
jgi:hypothetical protein